MLAGLADLSALLRRPIDEDDTSALAALETASGLVEAYLGQPVGLVEDDVVTLDGTGARVVLLPAYPVTAVSAVAVDGDPQAEGVDYEWSATGELRRRGGAWPATLRSLSVTYSHGFDPVPAAIVGVVAAVAARIYDTPLSVRQESIGGYSVTYTGGGVGLQAAEILILERYRRGA